MKRELRFGVSSLRRGPLVALTVWSVPEALPAAFSGLAVAHAVDDGFLAGRPGLGIVWLAGFMAASIVGAAGSRKVYYYLGELVEPFRDDLVRRVVGGSLRKGVAGHPDDGALARLTRQVEIVRDTYGGLLVVIRGFLVSLVGVVVGLLSLAPIVVLLILPPFLLGLVLFLAILGLSASRQRASIFADERLANTAGLVLAATRDVVASGAEKYAAALVAKPITEQAAAERSLAKVSALRNLCFAVGGWLPLLIVLFAGPWLVGQGLTTGAILGALIYIVSGLQPALQAFMNGVGYAGLRFVVTLGRILDATTPTRAVLDTRTSPAEARIT
jgi:ATP-binding cassette, subfamily C, bacterial